MNYISIYMIDDIKIIFYIIFKSYLRSLILVKSGVYILEKRFYNLFLSGEVRL
jgi:hypothetical protein